MNLSNFLSILRIILTFPTAYFIHSGEINYAIIIGIIAGITDFFDGYFARKLNQVTELGKIIDPIADKIFVAAIALVMILDNLLPLWFFIIVLVRDLLILLGGLYLAKKYDIILTSNFEGKATFVLIILTILGVLLNIEFASLYGFYLCTAAIIYSLILYSNRMFQVIANPTANSDN